METKKQVLIVDDQVINREILKKLLSEHYILIEAENGAVALTILRSCPQAISAVLLDLVMPVVDGYETMEEISKDPRLSRIPIVVISQADQDGAEERALQLGARDFLHKPYNPGVVRKRLANLIELYESNMFIDRIERDPLTGLYTKEAFFIHVAEKLAADPETAYMLVATDIERFKLVNDSFGTAEGDKLLCYTGERLLQNVHAVGGICCRHNSDHFVALAPSTADNGGLEWILDKSEKDFAHYPLGMKITFKFGVYLIDDTSIPISLMCDRAILAAESVKGQYHNVCAYYDGSILRAMLREQQITDEMKSALTKDEFRVYLQPKYSLTTEMIVGAEALVRWQHPTLGFLNPGEFIPLFEKNGFITELDLFVWETCCRGMRTWLDLGNPVIPVSVNVSRIDLYDPELGDILLDLVQKYRLPPKYMSLEITESAYTENADQLIEAVKKLKKLGFPIEMDDFGSGYSSLNTLSKLPIDVIKLDIGFLQSEKNSNGRSILSFIISLGKWLDLRIIAEGVETEEDVNMLRALNCDMAQGYYYARPMPIPDFEQLLGKQLASGRRLPQNRMPAEESNAPYCAQTIIARGVSASVCRTLTQTFSDHYSLVLCEDGEDMMLRIKESAISVAAIFISVENETDILQLERIVTACVESNIPVLSLHTTRTFLQAALKTGVTDCLLAPFLPELLKNRLENSICRMQSDRLEKENEINEALRDMKKRTQQDSLTGLYNRVEFENRVQEFFRDNSSPAAFFFIIDIDDFRSVNDQFGHDIGDRALIMLAKALRKEFPETELVGRMGGNEYALMIPYLPAKGIVENRLEELCRGQLFNIENISVTCSIGISTAPDDGLDFKTLYGRAETALFYAKRNGKKQYQPYIPELELLIDEKLNSRAMALLDQSSEATFVCDAVTNKVLYINDTACRLLNKSRKKCLGALCYQLFWNRSSNCDRCNDISGCLNSFYEEDTVTADGINKIHIKAKVEEWDGHPVKIHYLQVMPGA